MHALVMVNYITDGSQDVVAAIIMNLESFLSLKLLELKSKEGLFISYLT